MNMYVHIVKGEKCYSNLECDTVYPCICPLLHLFTTLVSHVSEQFTLMAVTTTALAERKI